MIGWSDRARPALCDSPPYHAHNQRQQMNLSWLEWKRWYWSCLILLGVINLAKGKYDGAAFFFGIVAVWAAATEWMRPRKP